MGVPDLYIMVALHPEGVDRNILSPSIACPNLPVALHPEGVDRNKYCSKSFITPVVALHPEGVDRNIDSVEFVTTVTWSPSTRRAWIEIEYDMTAAKKMKGSPSTRRAWIEIFADRLGKIDEIVALHPEGVDRNPLSS